MTMSVKMLNDIAVQAQAMAEAAQAMASAMQAVVDDCAAQLESKKAAAPAPSELAWVAEAEASIVNEEGQPAKKYSITEVRAYVAERTKPENRAQIRAILNKLGAEKLTELSEDKYGLLMKEVAKL